jgi:hypothetical protein
MNNKQMMQPNEEENVYGDVIGKLKQLNNINAPNNFEEDLFRKINSENYVFQKDRPSNFFLRKRLIPSLAVVAVAIILVIMIKTQPTRPEDPLSINPRIREDVIASRENSNTSVEDLAKRGFKENSTDQKPAKKLKAQSNSENNLIGRNEISSDKNNDTQLSNPLTDDANLQGYPKLSKSAIKNGLNFKQVYLDKTQRKEVAVLKEKMEKLYYESKN